jgi:hypothetical protein
MRQEDGRERRLIQLLCGTAARRWARQDEISWLMQAVDVGRVVALLKCNQLLILIGPRLSALGFAGGRELERELDALSASARMWGTGTELASLQILSRLQAAGIRALPLKGSILARQLYGDVAVRTSMDIDILIGSEDLTAAVAAVAELGWRWEPDAWRVAGLPVLHETLVHPSLPRVELHWRIHWYERRFAIDALARAEQSALGEPLQMQPLDGLIALMLFYARDGFAGLRFPADTAAWWDLRCAGSERPLPIDAVVDRYPDLAGPVRVASNLLSDLVGLPIERPADLPFRWRVAAGLATPFPEDGRQQADSNAALTDLLLAPPRATGGALGRVLRNAPADSSRSAAGPLPARLGHLLRVVSRWVVALVPAVARSYAPRRAAGR